MIEKQTFLRKTLILCFCLCVAACGYRGALYLPDEAPANQQDQTDSDPSVPESDNEPK